MKKHTKDFKREAVRTVLIGDLFLRRVGRLMPTHALLALPSSTTIR